MQKGLITFLAVLFLAGAAQASCPATPSECPRTTVGGLTIGGPVTSPGSGVAAMSFAVGQGSPSIVVAGTGYAAGDTVTMTCSGVTFTTTPVIGIGSVSAGVPTSVSVTRIGVATAAVPGTCTLTQTATSGTGTGLTVSVQFGVIAATISSPALATGGGVANGNLYLGAETPASTLAGIENTFFGARAGSAFAGAAIGDSAFGHNACGQGAAIGGVVGNYNTCLGNDAGRDITGNIAGNTLIGQGAGVKTASNNNTIIGQNAGPVYASSGGAVYIGQAAGLLSTGGAGNVIIGNNAGSTLTTGAENVIIGFGVASTTLQTGSFNIVIGIANNCDTAASNTSGSIRICSTGGLTWAMSGGATPSTSITSIAGGFQIGSTTNLTLAGSEFGIQKITASGSAPGAAGGKIALVCGTNAGSAKLIAAAGTSATAVTILDNIGSGVSGC